MSSAFYPLGMSSWNNRLPQGGYKSWKGDGILSNPVGITSGHIRPLTNNDSGNIFQTGFGLPRPMKHYRKGRVIPTSFDDLNINYESSELINYNLNRNVKSSKGSSLGGGGGGRGLLNELLDNPGSFIVKENTINNETNQLNNDCKTCVGTGIISSYYPNNTYLTDNPTANTENKILCCNSQQKARRRAIYASTNIKKNYFTALQQYRHNRCQTFDQKAFNFESPDNINNVKPGSPLALSNTYLSNCQPNMDSDLSNPLGCKISIYKPSNPQFAKQGAVSSSTRMLKLTVDTIETNAASFNKNAAGDYLNVNDITNGTPNTIPFILKNKVEKCNSTLINPFQNKKACYLSPRYNLSTKPFQPFGSSNHFAQSPVNPLAM